LCKSPVTAGFGVTALLGIKTRKTRQQEYALSTCLKQEPRPPALGSAGSVSGMVQPQSRAAAPGWSPLILHWGC